MSLRTKRDRIVIDLYELLEGRLVRDEREIIEDCTRRLEELNMFDMGD